MFAAATSPRMAPSSFSLSVPRRGTRQPTALWWTRGSKLAGDKYSGRIQALFLTKTRRTGLLIAQPRLE